MISVVEWDSRSNQATLIGTPEQWAEARQRIADDPAQSAVTRSRLTGQVDIALAFTDSSNLIRVTVTTYDAALILKRE